MSLQIHVEIDGDPFLVCDCGVRQEFTYVDSLPFALVVHIMDHHQQQQTNQVLTEISGRTQSDRK